MNFRKLGKTGLDVSVIGLGTEYLNRKSRNTVVSVIHEAIDEGVNYFDVVFSFREYRDNLAAAFQGRRDKIVIAGHICCAETRGHYRLSRDAKENEKLFLDLLRRFKTDYVDIIMIQMVNEIYSYEAITKPGGIMELVQRFKKQGKARFVGISGHKVKATVQTITTSPIDVLMFPINLAWDLAPGRKEIYQVCKERDVGLVAMKVFAGARLFNHAKPPTPIQCVEYALSQTNVATTVPGVKNVEQLRSVLRFTDATKREKNYRSIINDFQEDLRGNCVYCNHCLPCPAGIDIGRVIQKLDRTLPIHRYRHKEYQKIINFYYPGRIRIGRTHFKGLSLSVLKCNECGVCATRCPFDVDVIAKMRKAKELWQHAVRQKDK